MLALRINIAPVPFSNIGKLAAYVALRLVGFVGFLNTIGLHVLVFFKIVLLFNALSFRPENCIIIEWRFSPSAQRNNKKSRGPITSPASAGFFISPQNANICLVH